MIRTTTQHEFLEVGVVFVLKVGSLTCKVFVKKELFYCGDFFHKRRSKLHGAIPYKSCD